MSSVVSVLFCYPTGGASLTLHFSHLPRNTRPQHLTEGIVSEISRRSHRQPDSARPALSHLRSSTSCAFKPHECLIWRVLSSRCMLLKEYCAQQGSRPDRVCRRVSNFSRLTFAKDVHERFTLVYIERLHLMIQEVTWLRLSDFRAA
jgi:hypothetical protein